MEILEKELYEVSAARYYKESDPSITAAQLAIHCE